MTFKKNNLNCEILTSYKPSLVCKVGTQDIIVDEKNKIRFFGAGEKKSGYDEGLKDVSIGIDLNKPLDNTFFDYYQSDTEDKETTFGLMKGIREGRDDKELLLTKIQIKFNKRYYDDEEDKNVITMMHNFRGRFSKDNIIITKNLKTGGVPLDILDMMDKLLLKEAEMISSDNMEEDNIKLNWFRHSAGGYGGHDFQQVEFTKKNSDKTENILAIREANSFSFNKKKGEMTSTHNNLIFDKIRIKK